MAARDSAFGRFFAGLRRTVPPTAAGGTTGTAIYGGYIERKERNPALETTRERYRIFSDIVVNVSIVSAGLRYFLNLVGKAGWKVEPADDSPQAQEIADFVEAAMDDMASSWPRIVRRTAGYRIYGFSLQEWVAKRTADGRLNMKDVHPRPQHTIERWDCNMDGEILGVIQCSPQTSEELYIPRNKLVYAVDDAISDSPEGFGLLRHIVEPAQRLQRLEQLEAFGYETDLRGIPIIKAPLAELQSLVEKGEITPKQAADAIAPLQAFMEKHTRNPQLALMIDSTPYQSEDEAQRPSNTPMYDVSLLSSQTDNSSMEAAAMAIERLNREIARVLGVEHLLLGGDGTGSLALSRDKTQNFGLVVDSTLSELEDVFEKDFARMLVLLNGWPEELTPKLKTEQIQYRDIQQITEALRDLSEAGLLPSDPAVNEIRDLLGLSRVPEEIIDALMAASMAGGEERERSRSASNASISDNPDETVTPEAIGQEEEN